MMLFWKKPEVEEPVQAADEGLLEEALANLGKARDDFFHVEDLITNYVSEYRRRLRRGE